MISIKSFFHGCKEIMNYSLFLKTAQIVYTKLLFFYFRHQGLFCKLDNFLPFSALRISCSVCIKWTVSHTTPSHFRHQKIESVAIAKGFLPTRQPSTSGASCKLRLLAVFLRVQLQFGGSGISHLAQDTNGKSRLLPVPLTDRL